MGISMINFSKIKAQSAFRRQRAAFLSDASIVLQQGVKFHDVLALKISFNRGKPLGQAFDEIYERFCRGSKLSDSFEGYLPSTEQQSLQGWDEAKSDKEIAAGFAIVGSLAQAFGAIQSQMRQTIIKSISALSIMFFILWQMNSTIYPSIIQNFPVAKWGFFARMFYYFVNMLFSNVFLLGAALIGVVIAYAWSLKNWSSPQRRLLDKTIIYAWWRSYRSLAVLLSLALNLKSNPSVNSALRNCMKVAGHWEYWYLQEMMNRNNLGEKGGEVFNVGFFDEPIMERILMLSSTGSAEKALETIAFTTQKELLEGFRVKIEGYGVMIKNIALVGGAIPVIMFFSTVGIYILSVVGGR